MTKQLPYAEYLLETYYETDEGVLGNLCKKAKKYAAPVAVGAAIGLTGAECIKRNPEIVDTIRQGRASSFQRAPR